MPATNDNSFGTTGYVGSESFDMFGLREYAFDLDLDVIHNGESIRNKGTEKSENVMDFVAVGPSPAAQESSSFTHSPKNNSGETGGLWPPAQARP